MWIVLHCILAMLRVKQPVIEVNYSVLVVLCSQRVLQLQLVQQQ